MMEPSKAKQTLIWALKEEAKKFGQLPGSEGQIESMVANLTDDQVHTMIYEGFKQGKLGFKNALGAADETTANSIVMAQMRDAAQAKVNATVAAVTPKVAPNTNINYRAASEEGTPPPMSLTTPPVAMPPIESLPPKTQTKADLWDYISSDLMPAAKKAGASRTNPDTLKVEETPEQATLNSWVDIWRNMPNEASPIKEAYALEHDRLANELLGKQIGNVGVGEAQANARAQQQMAMQTEQNRIQNEQEQTKMQMSALGTLGGWANTAANNIASMPGSYVIPEGMKYMPGWEPGGPIESTYKGLGLQYTPQEVKGTPVDFNAATSQYGSFLKALAGIGGQ
jgi:hypothetical protein